VNKSTDLTEVFAPAEVASDPKQKFLGKEFALLDRYELQEALVETLRQTKNHRHLVDPVLNCHKSFRSWVCRNNHKFALAEKSCSCRVCPHCCRRRSLVLAGRMEKFLIGKPMNTLRYAVLSERNCMDLGEGAILLWQSWTRLRHSVCWKRKVKGCIAAMEVTRNVEEKTWHPHLNVLMEGDYFPVEELRQSWMEATEFRSETAFIRAADAGTVRELIKYVTKISDLIGDALALDEFLTAVYKKRLVRTYGTFYRLKLEDEDAPRLQQCPDCDSTELVKLGLVPPQQISMDLKGVLRMKRPRGEIEREIQKAIEFSPELPREKVHNYMPLVRKRWDKAGMGFAERHEDLMTAAEFLGVRKINTIAGWGYSEFLKKLSQSAEGGQ
jgi:Replication protein